MHQRNPSIIQLHLAVLLFGCAGLFGKLINEPPVVIVFGRTSLATIALFCIIKLQGNTIKFQGRRDIFGFTFMGLLLAFHWITFFKSVQISTVAIGLLTYASFPAFVTIFEPLFFNGRYNKRDIVYVFLVGLGLVIIVPQFSFENQITAGVFWGLLSGMSFAILTILNKQYGERYSAFTIAFFQDGVASVILMPFFLNSPKDLSGTDIGYIVILGIICTALAHTLFIQSMKKVRAFTAGIVACLEPVYGIILAGILLHEVPSLRALIGGLMIVLVVLKVSARPD